MGIDSPNIEANLPTPWIGVWERINIGVYMIWVMVLAILLLRAEKRQHQLSVKMPGQATNVKPRKSKASQLQ
ncbi:MAG TPA: hypothetical protein VGQ09_19175 [Chitinophagaceae bacterium]|jgi:hypothetical protein|nr:hypothetical protein [Chitinophagaceae bacterium]